MLALAAMPLGVSGEVAEDISALAPADSVKQKAGLPKLQGMVDFDPVDYLLPDRYMVQGDSFETRKLGTRLFVGVHTGARLVVPQGGSKLKPGMPADFFVGYRFSHLHALRLTGSHILYDMERKDGSVEQWGADVDYMFDFTSYLYGYKRRRALGLSAVLGAGYVHSTYKGKAEHVVKGQAGLNMYVNLGRNVRLFAEPFFALASDNIDHSGNGNVAKYDMQYGVKAGLSVNFDNMNNYYGNEVVYTKGFFYEVAQGLSFFNSKDLGLLKTLGTGYRVSVGRWFDPIVGLRLSASGQEYYWSHEITPATASSPSYDRLFKGRMLALRLEGLVNPLNFGPRWRQVRHPFDFVVSVGGEYGWLSKNIPRTKDGLKCLYAGFTGALQLLYNLDKETAFFVEPRVTLANFREPYLNVDRHASFTETSMMLSAGVRICAANKQERARWPRYFFEHRLFSGVNMGGLKHMLAEKRAGEFAPNLSGAFYVGYHLGRYASVKAQVEYLTLNRNAQMDYKVSMLGVDRNFSAQWRLLDSYLHFKLSYMLNLSNIYQRYDLNRRFNFYIEAGALYATRLSRKAFLYEMETQVPEGAEVILPDKAKGAPAVFGGAVGQYRVNDHWSLLLQPEVQYYLRNDYLGGRGPTPLNDIVVKMSVGTSYTF